MRLGKYLSSLTKPELEELKNICNFTDEELKKALSETCDYQPFIAKAPMVLVFCAD